MYRSAENVDHYIELSCDKVRSEMLNTINQVIHNSASESIQDVLRYMELLTDFVSKPII